jgi:hypothetical protein
LGLVQRFLRRIEDGVVGVYCQSQDREIQELRQLEKLSRVETIQCFDRNTANWNLITVEMFRENDPELEGVLLTLYGPSKTSNLVAKCRYK